MSDLTDDEIQSAARDIVLNLLSGVEYLDVAESVSWEFDDIDDENELDRAIEVVHDRVNEILTELTKKVI